MVWNADPQQKHQDQKRGKNQDDLWHSQPGIPKSKKGCYKGRRWPGKIRLVAAGTSSEKSRSHQNGLCDLRVAMSGVDSISFFGRGCDFGENNHLK